MAKAALLPLDRPGGQGVHAGAPSGRVRASGVCVLRRRDREKCHLHATFRGDRDEAEVALADLVARADAEAARVAGVRKPKEAPSLTVADACGAWFAWAVHHLEPGSLVSSRDNIDRYILRRIGDVELWRLRGYVVHRPDTAEENRRWVSLTDFYAALEAHGGRCRCPASEPDHAPGVCPYGAPLSPSTVRRVHATLRTILKFAVAQEWLMANPAAEARLTTVPRRRSTAPTPEVLAAFLRYLAAENPELFAFTHVLMSGGRRVDGLGLQWADVDFDAGEIVLGERGVVRSLDTQSPRRMVVRETSTTKRRRRRVAMSEATSTALRRHRQRCLEAALGAGVRLADQSFVFSPDPDGSRARLPDWPSTEWRRATSRAARDSGLTGLDHVRLYDVRHFFATRLLATGIKEVEIAELMGNSPSTMRYHDASSISVGGRDAADAMDRILRDGAAGNAATRGRGAGDVGPAAASEDNAGGVA